MLQSTIEHHLTGTHFNIRVDPADGLLFAAAEGYQLTWMDAKVDSWADQLRQRSESRAFLVPVSRFAS